jgi:hypothetical protein
MDEIVDTGRLPTTLDALARIAIVPGVASVLEPAGQEIAAAIGEAAVAEVPAYADTGNPDVRPELLHFLAATVDDVIRLLGGGRPGDFAFVAAHAERRAEQKFPLAALLQTYRCSHRILVERIRDGAIAVAADDAHLTRVVSAVTDFCAELTGTLAAVTTSAYVHRTRAVAEAEGDRRTALLNTLLDGYDEADQHAAQLLRRAGYLAQRQSYCVAVARAVNPQEMESLPRAQRMADAVSVELDRGAVRSIVGIRDGLVVAVMSATRRLSGWTAPHSSLATLALPLLRRVGPAALIGVGSDAPSTSHIPRILAEAKLALDYASVSRRVVSIAEIPLRRMLISQASDPLRLALPVWAAALDAADRRGRGRLFDTLQAYADNDMNVLRTARSLSLHANTVYARMQKIADITGLSPLGYHGLTEILLALECRRNSGAPVL